MIYALNITQAPSGVGGSTLTDPVETDRGKSAEPAKSIVTNCGKQVDM